MLALSHQFSTNIGHWPTEDHEQRHYNFYRDFESPISSAQSLLCLNLPASTSASDRLRGEENNIGSEPTSRAVSSAVKKLNHNACERDRRRKVNQLYSSLRGLLPPSDHTKKLSIPGTVSKVLKYIPELQQQLEGLVQRRDELMSKFNSRKLENLQVKEEAHNEMKRSFSTSSLTSVSASQLSDKEVGVQISTFDKNSLSEVLCHLEADGLSVINVSTFVSLGGRVFHSLHLQANGSHASAKCGTLKSKFNQFSTH